MFNIKSHLVKSKVGYRLLGLFLLSALVPVIILAIPSFKYIGNELAGKTEEKLQYSAKAIGSSINDRLTIVSREFIQLTEDIYQQANSFDENTFLDGNLKLKQYDTWFNSLSIIRPSQALINLLGVPSMIPSLSGAEIDWLKEGRPLLKINYGSKNQAQIFLFQLFDKGRPDRGLLAGELNNTFILNLNRLLPQHTIACVLDKQAYPIHCSKKLPVFTLQNLVAKHRDKTMGTFQGDIDGNAYLHSYWAKFSNNWVAPNWTVLVSSSKAQALIPIKKFNRIFPLTLLFSTILIIILSIRQIRKVLIPLEKLREGTQNVANQNFHSQVEVSSGDEFEELADSFNQMSAKLGKQFSALETMARIDRLILSTLNIDNIVETILVRMVHAVPCDSIALIISDDTHSHTASLYFRPDMMTTEIQTSAVSFTEIEMSQLRDNKKTLMLEKDVYLPEYMRSISETMNNFLLLPIFLENELSAVIILCYKKEPKFPDEDIRQARDLADRVAVALSNAAWEDKLYTQAHYDDLTGLPNRLLFQDRIHHSIKRAARENTLVALLFLDLDHFKSLNDSLGHSAGDEFLKEIARRIKGCVRSVDTVARLGGDEFTVVIPDLKNDDEAAIHVSNIANKMLEETSKPFNIAGQEIIITISIGVSIYPTDADNFGDLLKASDSALYYAKSKGKRNYQFYSEEIDAESKDLLIMESKLKSALKKDEFSLYYQPRVDSRANRVIGAEALLRWNMDGEEMISPEKFVPIIEECGLVLPVGEWVLRQAAESCKEWHNLGFSDQTISVNLSALQFTNENITKVVSNILRDTGLDPKFLELEITEGTVMTDIDKTIRILEEFKQMGVSLSIDDFGTGYSSLSYLKKLPIHLVKIDKSFIKDIQHDVDNAAIVSAIIKLSQTLNLEVIAEGVETQAELDFLKENDCFEVQGYYYSKPLCSEDYVSYLKSNKSIKSNKVINIDSKK